MKKILIIVAFLFILPTMAQKEKAILYFKNGKEIKGLASITGKDKIKFRPDLNSKRKTYDHNDISTIVIDENGILNEYNYLVIESSSKNSTNKIMLLHKYIDGKMRLYKRKYWSTIKTGSEIVNPSIKKTDYYIAKDSSVLAFPFGNTGRKKFIKIARNKFKDCPELVKKIENKIYTSSRIEDIVQFYNYHCK